MDIYLTNLKTKERLRFPMLPTEVNVGMANRFASYSVIKTGEVKIPNGTSPDSFSWEGIFPGKNRKGAPYVREWKKPKEAYKFIRALKAKNGKPVKARLLVTGTPINSDVYLADFNVTPTGGYNDINYSITLVQAKQVKVKKKKKDKKKKLKAGKLQGGANERKTPERPSQPQPQTYTVAAGDSLWKIAQRFYGNGAQYTKIYEANKGTIGSNPDLIYPGQTFVIPA